MRRRHQRLRKRPRSLSSDLAEARPCRCRALDIACKAAASAWTCRKPAGAQISVSGASLASIGSISRARSRAFEAPWAAKTCRLAAFSPGWAWLAAWGVSLGKFLAKGIRCCDGAHIESMPAASSGHHPAAGIAGQNRETPFTGLRDFSASRPGPNLRHRIGNTCRNAQKA